MTKRRVAYRLTQAVVVLVLLLFLTVWLWFLLPFWGLPFNWTRHTETPITPPWALECWLWEDDVNTADFVRELVAGYEMYDIPARTILIDSPWSTRYNDFALDETRYPDPAQFFGDLQNKGYRVVLWMTPVVNAQSDDTAIPQSADWFEEARRKGYLTSKGRETEWWKGRGGFIDYTNPDAMKWWRGMQQQVFDWGIDGWKLDGAATLNARWLEMPGWVPKVETLALPYLGTHAGLMTTRKYMDHYYRDEYKHGLTQNPEFITLARSIDDPRVHPEGFAPFDAAPVTWVGDQDHAWSKKEEGLEEALDYVMRSARLGYCVIGSDVGGYGGSTIAPEVYIRWAQFSAFCGLFLNGGHGERRLWLRTPQELEIIRRYAWLHNELVPYIYSHVVECHNGGEPLMRPEGAKYDYFFGDDLFISPIYGPSEDGQKTTWPVMLPEGRWRYFFNDREVFDGQTRVEKAYGLNEFPAFVRDGAIIPMNVTREYSGFGDRASAGFLTLAIFPGAKGEFTVHHTDGSGETKVSVDGAPDVEVRLEGVHKPHILRVRMDAAPRGVTLDGKALVEDETWRYDNIDGHLWLRTSEYGEGQYRILAGQPAPAAG